jgi:transcriptional regulator with XRE-family HTH domain
MKKITYEDVLARIGFFRNNKNLSARATSFELGCGELFLSRIENGTHELRMKTFLELCDVFEITPQDFFYLGKEYNPESKNVLELFGNLSATDQQTILNLMKSLQK